MSKQQEFTLGPFYGELAARAAEARGHLTGARLGAQGVMACSLSPKRGRRTNSDSADAH
jgi:hypothetical protein